MFFKRSFQLKLSDMHYKHMCMHFIKSRRGLKLYQQQKEYVNAKVQWSSNLKKRLVLNGINIITILINVHSKLSTMHQFPKDFLIDSTNSGCFWSSWKIIISNFSTRYPKKIVAYPYTLLQGV